MDLKVDVIKVREAASQCPDAARILKTLFPQAFDPEPMKVGGAGPSYALLHNGQQLMQVRVVGTFTRKAVYLSDHADWRLIRESNGDLILVAYEKGQAPACSGSVVGLT